MGPDAGITRVHHRSISARNTEVSQIIRVPAVRSITHDVINELELDSRDRPFRHPYIGRFKWQFLQGDTLDQERLRGASLS